MGHAVAILIDDVGNNAGDILITPNGVEKIMGFANYTLGSGGSLTLYPSVALGGWYKGN